MKNNGEKLTAVTIEIKFTDSSGASYTCMHIVSTWLPNEQLHIQESICQVPTSHLTFSQIYVTYSGGSITLH